MRNELELIERIELYLNGKLDGAEKAAFELQMKNDESLGEAVALQADVMKGIDRTVLKQHVKQAAKHYHSRKNFVRWGIGGAILIVAVVVIIFFIKRQHHFGGGLITTAAAYNGTSLPALNEAGLAEWATADSLLPVQTFMIDAGKDTVIETRQGIVFAIPAGAFLMQDGKVATGPVSIFVKEALDPFTIMTAGLSTRSGDRLLETGGMFFLDARKGDAILKIDPTNGIYAEVPADAPKAGMQLFSGKRMPGGSIDWVNPEPLARDLVPVGITSLDFYPPEYLPLLQHDGYPTRNKRFTDSVYYSLAALFSGSGRNVNSWGESDSAKDVARDTTTGPTMLAFGRTLFYRNCATCHNPVVDATGPALQGKSYTWPSPQWVYEWVHNPSAMIAKGDKHAMDVFNKWKPTVMTAFPALKNEEIDAIINYVNRFDSMCGINPAKIKAIWNDRYANTLLATREFEQRLKLIHQSKTPALLDLYVNNLNKNLYEIDSMAARMSDRLTSQSFLRFAALHQGKVRDGSKQFRELKEYYALKTRILTEAIVAAEEKIRSAQERSDDVVRQKVATQRLDEQQRSTKNFQEELEYNMESAYKQLGYERTPVNAIRNTGFSNAVIVANTGWNNVDRYVVESTINRSTLDYTDPQTGKKAVVEYKPFSVRIKDAKSYERLMIYLIPDRLSSFIKVPGVDGVFSEKLNGLMHYDMVVVGIKGHQQYFACTKGVAPKAYEGIQLKAIDSVAFMRAMNELRLVSQVTAFKKEIEFAIWDLQNARLQQERLKWEAMISELRNTLFPCATVTESVYNSPPPSNKVSMK